MVSLLFQSKFEYFFTTAMYSYVFKIKLNRKVNQGSYLVDIDSREYSIDLNLINKNSFISKEDRLRHRFSRRLT